MTHTRTLSAEDLNRLTEQFTHSARRLETRRSYTVDVEAPALAAYARGDRTPLTDPHAYPYYQPWFAQIRAATAAGRLVQRIRILDQPPTPYQEWEIWIAQFAAQAGEDIRYLTRAHAQALDVPTDSDWWLLDETRLIILDFDEADQPLGGRVTTDPHVVRAHGAWWDQAAAHASTAPPTDSTTADTTTS